MTSLTKAQRMTKVFALAAAGALVLFLVVRIALTALDAFTSSPRQLQAQNKLDITFGQLPQPKLPIAEVATTNATMDLDLVSGNLPQSTSSATVYKITNSALSLSAQDRARAKATNLGFTTQPTQPNSSTFQWKEGARTLTIDLNDQTYDLTTDLDKITFSSRESFNRFSPVSRMSSQFIQNQLKFSDLQYDTDDSPDSQFVNPVNGAWVPQSDNAVSTTNYAHITFLRQKLNDLPIYAASGKVGPISMVIIPKQASQNTSSRNELVLQLDQLVELHNHYIPIQQDNAASYPVITPQKAFTLLETNPGKYLVSVKPINSTNTASSFNDGRVQFVSLVYLEPDDRNHDYVQPAWMFEGRASTNAGDARWIAYVPAVDSDLVKELLLR